jgi:hypothetical protein
MGLAIQRDLELQQVTHVHYPHRAILIVTKNGSKPMSSSCGCYKKILRLIFYLSLGLHSLSDPFLFFRTESVVRSNVSIQHGLCTFDDCFLQNLCIVGRFCSPTFRHVSRILVPSAFEVWLATWRLADVAYCRLSPLAVLAPLVQI